ncbi:FHA domain-containing protein [Mycobacterium sp. BK086]|uniref:FHA domain-containing protein n=1 Tax=Mycobacterium sp. BK086 TaxID=2512165 RepID=UPI00105CE3A0|nr:FHA domain-containing protein [Mycobacterium sp. BK086]TDO06602.1 FHA domain-containing protein [Mycobacterium sp. BK086]
MTLSRFRLWPHNGFRNRPGPTRVVLSAVGVLWILVEVSARDIVVATLVVAAFGAVLAALVSAVRVQRTWRPVKDPLTVVDRAVEALPGVIRHEQWWSHAPGIVRVRLNDDDHGALVAHYGTDAIMEYLTDQYLETIRRFAAVQDFSGSPSILIESTPRQRRGTCWVQAVAPAVPGRAFVPSTRRDDGHSTSNTSISISAGRGHGKYLELATDGRVHRVVAPSATIGRSRHADVQIALDPWMSRVHAVVRNDGGAWWIADRSANGCAVNGVAVSGWRQLHDGDVVAWGRHSTALRSVIHTGKGAEG